MNIDAMPIDFMPDQEKTSIVHCGNERVVWRCEKKVTGVCAFL